MFTALARGGLRLLAAAGGDNYYLRSLGQAVNPVYLDLLHPLGPLHGGLRALLGIDDPRDLRLPDARSLAGCIVLLGAVLYPYVYLTTRAMFMTQAGGLLEAARSLGTPSASLFHRVALPLARPAIAVTALFAFMSAYN